MKEIIMNLWDGLVWIYDTFVVSYEGIATLFVIFMLFLKLLVNRRATAIDRKQMIVSIPSEITFLVIGFIISNIIKNKSQLLSDMRMESNIAIVVISLIILVIQYALERFMDDKLSGKLSAQIKIIIPLMYIASIVLYVKVVYGG